MRLTVGRSFPWFRVANRQTGEHFICHPLTNAGKYRVGLTAAVNPIDVAVTDNVGGRQ